jgi:hypothetical protein
MPLALRPTSLSSPVHRDQLDYTVFEDGRAIGRMYEDPHTRAELRWFWSIIRIVQMPRGENVITNARPMRARSDAGACQIAVPNQLAKVSRLRALTPLSLPPN